MNGISTKGATIVATEFDNRLEPRALEKARGLMGDVALAPLIRRGVTVVPD
jgi:hypothetical protein